MKKYFIAFLTFIILNFSANIFAQDWGLTTNGVQASLSSKNIQVKTNAPVIVLFKIKNTSTNETFYFNFLGSAEPSFSYSITSPSGKVPPRNEKFTLTGFGTGPFPISPRETNEFKLNLSRLYYFDEVGTYILKAKVKMESQTTIVSHGDQTVDEDKTFQVVSNPLLITVVSDK